MSTYDLYKNKAYSLRISDEMKLKIKIIAEQLGYTKTSKLYEKIIANYIDQYEQEHGEIAIKKD